MTLLITVFAAITTTILWYALPESKMKLGTLSLMYWGASLMWLVDAIAEYIELGAEYFMPEAADMTNDAFLGICVVAFGLIIWLVTILLKDPNGRIKAAIANKN